MAASTFTSSLKRDLDEIMRAPPGYKPYFLLGTRVHTPLKTLDENDGVLIMGMTDNRDYKDNEFCYVEMDLYVRPGCFAYEFYPYVDDMEITVTWWKQERVNGQAIKVEERFKLVYLVEQNTALPTDISASKEIMDQKPPLNVRVQLMPLPAMIMRLKTTQGVYSQKISPTNKDMKGDSLLRSIVSHECKKIEINGDPAIAFLEIEESHNMTPMTKMIIPTGTRVMEMAHFLHEEKGGLYRGGVGTFMQRYTPNKTIQPANGLFIYSLFDGSKYKDAENKIIFYVPPDGSHNTVSKTYSCEPGVIKIMTNPIKGLYDFKKNIEASEGEGFRMANADVMGTRPSEVTNKGPKFKKTELVTEVVHEEKENGLVNASYAGVTSNVFTETSNVLARVGEMCVLVVDNFDPDYISPAGACVIAYEVGDNLVQKLYGVIHKVQIQYYYQTFDSVGEYTMLEHALTTRVIFYVYVTGGADEI